MSIVDGPDPSCTLLIVDDNEIDRYLLKRFLRVAGVDQRVLEVEHGEQALEFFEQYVMSAEHGESPGQPLVVFLDFNMPRKTGLEFLADFDQLRKEYPHIKSSVVMLSTAERDDEQQQALSYDFVKGYFKKGAIDPQSLSALVNGLQHNATQA